MTYYDRKRLTITQTRNILEWSTLCFLVGYVRLIQCTLKFHKFNINSSKQNDRLGDITAEQLISWKYWDICLPNNIQLVAYIVMPELLNSTFNEHANGHLNSNSWHLASRSLPQLKRFHSKISKGPFNIGPSRLFSGSYYMVFVIK